jgi:hypothetical protein
MAVVYRDLVDQLTRMSPSAKNADLGDLLEQFVAAMNVANQPTIDWNDAVDRYNFLVVSMNNAARDIIAKTNALITKSNAICNFLTSTDSAASATFTNVAFSLSSAVHAALSTAVKDNSASTASPTTVVTLDSPRTTFNAAVLAINSATTAANAAIASVSVKLNKLGDFLAATCTDSATFITNTGAWSDASASISSATQAPMAYTASSASATVVVATMNETINRYNSAALSIASATTTAAGLIAAQVVKVNKITDFMTALAGGNFQKMSGSGYSAARTVASAVGAATVAPASANADTITFAVPVRATTLVTRGNIG